MIELPNVRHRHDPRLAESLVRLETLRRSVVGARAGDTEQVLVAIGDLASLFYELDQALVEIQRLKHKEMFEP